MAKSIKELKSLSDEALVLEHDEIGKSTVVGLNYYLQEIERREHTKSADRMERFTRYILWLTVFIAFLTIANVALVAFQIASTTS